jgi:hypothetical protein
MLDSGGVDVRVFQSCGSAPLAESSNSNFDRELPKIAKF